MSTVHDETATTTGALTDDEIAFFDDNGYLVLRNRIPAALLERLQRSAERWIGDGRGGDDDDPRNTDYKFAQRPDGRVMFRVDYLHNKNESSSLELLGAPCMLGIAQSLVGPNFVPTYESLVFKDEGDGAPIEWHQDAVHPRTARIFNVDVYLDNSFAGAGALRVVPGSQRRAQDICAMEHGHGWDVPGVVEVEMGPSDVLVHDVMLVHGSPPVRGNALRRTIYYEFRAAEQILAEGPWDSEWIDRRLRLVPVALDRHANAFPEAQQFVWAPDPALRPAASGDDEAELRVAHLVGNRGTFCSAGSV